MNNIIEILIDKINNPNGNQHSLPNVILDNTEIELLKGLANGNNLREINSAIRIYSRNVTFYSVAESLLKKLEAYNLVHATYKALKLNII